MVNRYLLPANHHPARRIRHLAGSTIPYRAATGVFMYVFFCRLVNQDRASLGHRLCAFSVISHVSGLQFLLREVDII